MLVLFDHLTPVCMLVIEAFQSSIAFTLLSKRVGVGLAVQMAYIYRHL